MKDLGFVESKNTHLILFSAVFLVLGFLPGRVTGHQRPRMHKGHLGCMEVGDNVWVSDGEVEVMMFTDKTFEGDTVIALPGGGIVNVTSNGDDMEVEVNMEEVMESMTGGQTQDVQIIRKESGDGEVRVEKRIVVVRDEKNDFP